MSYEQRDNSGALFRNEDRKTEKHANARGSAVIDGVHYFVDAWTKQGAKGPWQSLAFKRKDKQPDAEPQRRAPDRKTDSGFDQMDSDIPF
jgi:hypothetical protein